MTIPRRPTHIVRFRHVVRCGLVALTLAVSLGACGGNSSDGQQAGGAAGGNQGTNVKVAMFRFQPGSQEVPVGTTVTWRNEDAILHTVTAGVPGEPTGTFDKEMPDKGTTASVTFDRAGTFSYFCARHPEAMRGEIIVQ